MTRVKLLMRAAFVAAAVLAAAQDVLAQGFRSLNVGTTTVVVGRPTGKLLAAAANAAPGVRFRSLTPDTRATLVRTASELPAGTVPARLTRTPGGVALVTVREARLAPAEPPSRAISSRTGFRPLSAQAKAALVQAAAPAGEVPPAASTPAESPFTLTLATLSAAGRAFLQITDAHTVSGGFGFAGFNTATGAVGVIANGTRASQYMIHFQVFSTASSAFDYSVMLGDGSTTRVSARLGGAPQDIVVFLYLPAGQTPVNWSALATLLGSGKEWYFAGVEVTPM